MANFRRRYPRIRTPWRVRHMWSWSQAWDLIHHRRPRRRKETKLLKSILRGERDPDGLAWPLGNKKPHEYYW